MRINCDAAYKDGMAGLSCIAISDAKIILNRWAKTKDAPNSFVAERYAVEYAIDIATKCYDSCDIYTDCESYKEGKFINSKVLLQYQGDIYWFDRKENKLADGLAKATLDGVLWRDEYSYASMINVVANLTPGTWTVRGLDGENFIVKFKNDSFRCSCGNPYMKYKLLCRHLIAVFRHINLINEAGEEVIINKR